MINSVNKNKIIIFSDGASKGNPGPGGFGAVIVFADKVTELGGREEHTTNNRMELTAALEALSFLPAADKAGLEEIEVYTDSKYVIGGMTDWLFNWQKNNWRTANKKPVLNKDLWEKLAALAKGRKICWHYVAGHAGHAVNERCDEIASALALGNGVDFYAGPAKTYQVPLNLPRRDE